MQQIQLWKTQYPDETWNCLKVAILGIHGPKDGYVLKQYEPHYEKDVIYVEFPEISDIFSNRNKSTA